MQLTLGLWNLQRFGPDHSLAGDPLKHIAHFAAHHDAAFVIGQGTNGNPLQKDTLPAIRRIAQSQYGTAIEGDVFNGTGDLLFCFVRSTRPESNLVYEMHLQKLSPLNGGKTGPVIASLGIWDKSASR